MACELAASEGPERGREYARRIELNRIYHDEFKRREGAIILSASFCEYLTPLFPDSPVIASEIRYDGDRPAGILRHCHGNNKVAMLHERCRVLDVRYAEDATHVRVRAPALLLAEMRSEL